MAKLSFYDYAFLLTETADSPKHVAGLQIFEPPADYEGDFVADLIEQLAQRPPGPPFNFKFRRTLLGSPEWVEDESFDLDYHLRHSRLPHPGSKDQLMDLVGRLHAVLLDRMRPLWEVHVIEGLEGGRFALYAKIHHSYCDGITLVKIMMGTLKSSPEDRDLRASWESRGSAVLRKPESGSTVGKGMEIFKQGLGTAFELSSLAARMTLQRLGLGDEDLPVPFTAPRTLLNAPVNRARRAAIGRLSLGDTKDLAKATNTKLNDVVLTVCDIALGRYLREHGDEQHAPLVAQMPLNLRRDGNHEMGNQIAILPVVLGNAGREPLKRLNEISRSSAVVKHGAGTMSADAVSIYTLALQGVAQAGEIMGASTLLPPLGNVLISNVPGPQMPLFFWGARLVSSFPLSAIPPGLAINITFFSYDGRLDVGLIAGYDAVPDIAAIPDYMNDAFSALQAAVNRKETRVKKRRSAVRAVVNDEDGKTPAAKRGKNGAGTSSRPARKTAATRRKKAGGKRASKGNGSSQGKSRTKKSLTSSQRKKARRKSTARVTVS
ncbi:MAG: wax ester/triacylglycerol synthase family O-acyltransferase [Gammaproteobacteria bacterium]